MGTSVPSPPKSTVPSVGPHGPIAAADPDLQLVGQGVRETELELRAGAVCPFRGKQRAQHVIVDAVDAYVGQVGSVGGERQAGNDLHVGGDAQAQGMPSIILGDGEYRHRDRCAAVGVRVGQLHAAVTLHVLVELAVADEGRHASELVAPDVVARRR